MALVSLLPPISSLPFHLSTYQVLFGAFFPSVCASLEPSVGTPSVWLVGISFFPFIVLWLSGRPLWECGPLSPTTVFLVIDLLEPRPFPFPVNRPFFVSFRFFPPTSFSFVWIMLPPVFFLIAPPVSLFAFFQTAKTDAPSFLHRPSTPSPKPPYADTARLWIRLFSPPLVASLALFRAIYFSSFFFSFSNSEHSPRWHILQFATLFAPQSVLRYDV